MNLVHRILAPAVLGLSFGLSVAAYAQDGEETVECEKLPATVRSAFVEAYPNATMRACVKEVEDERTFYKIESSDSRGVLYDPEGVLIVVETPSAVSDLPEKVQQAARKKFPKGKIMLAEKLTRGSSVTYELQLKYKGKTAEIIFDPNGKEVEP
jgi:putative PepSY-like beta-lactamase-inhibitor